MNTSRNVDRIVRRAFTEFTLANGCKLDKPAGVAQGIWGMTGGQPCEDCGCKPCDLLEKFKKEDRTGVAAKPVVADLKTNAELGAEHGITKRQAAKRRIPGTNELSAEV